MTAFGSIHPRYCRIICVNPEAGNENFPRPFLSPDLDALRPASAVSQVIGLVDRSYLTCAGDSPSSALCKYAGEKATAERLNCAAHARMQRTPHLSNAAEYAPQKHQNQAAMRRAVPRSLPCGVHITLPRSGVGPDSQPHRDAPNCINLISEALS